MSDPLTVICGDALTELRELPAESVQCCVTSPPYWGLRDYQTGAWEGGEAGCDHKAGRFERGGLSSKQASNNGSGGDEARTDCPKCGARRVDAQLGLEKTPEEYVGKMVEVFREVRRVLRKDGTCWVNLGDSFNSIGGTVGGGKNSEPRKATLRLWTTLKPKDLVGIPWRVAFALQADGWWLRSDIIWAKPNPMPESVTDRPTKAHEYLFLFAKGSWVHRSIKFSDLPDEFVHFVNHGWKQVSPVRELMLGRVAIQLATTFLDCSQGQDNLSLPPFYDEVWKQSADGSDSSFVSSLPKEHRAAVWSCRFLASQCSTKRFLQELQRLIVNHPATYHFLKAGIISQFANAPHIYCNGDCSFTVNDSGHICEFQIMHGQIIIAKPTSCNYFYDAEAIKEKVISENPISSAEYRASINRGGNNRGVGNFDNGTTQKPIGNPESGNRNKRSVWTVAIAPYPEAHFATYPPDLIKPCILAGTSAKGCCANCGAPWERVVERGEILKTNFDCGNTRPYDKSKASGMQDVRSEMNMRYAPGHQFENKTLGWQPTCVCSDQVPFEIAFPTPVPCTVLDPFAGSGTTGAVALELGRRAILIELNPAYVQLIRERCNITPGLALA